MKLKRFKSWDWEFDIGKDAPGPLNDTDFAEAMYDNEDRLMRVLLHSLDGEVFVYDYFCNDDGRVCEKRSLNQDGTIHGICKI